MINKLKSTYRKHHISTDWIRLGPFYRFNKKNKKLINIRKRRPNLIICGAQKCGTTSLFHYLSQHPDIAGSSPKKEPGYFMFDGWAQDFWRRKNEIIIKSKNQLLENYMYKELTNEIFHGSFYLLHTKY